MKKYKIYWILVVSGLLSSVIFAHQLTLSKVGEWGTGAYKDAFVKGNYAYCAAGYAGLDIINIANPANPQKIGNCDTPGSARDVYVSGNYAYVITLDLDANTNQALGKLIILDISNPTSPQQLGTMSLPYTTEIYVVGNYAYVASADFGTGAVVANRTVSSSGKLCIVNVANPASPSLVGNIDLPEAAWDVYVSGNYAYVTCGFSGLMAIDISKPTSPTLPAVYDTSGPAKRVNVMGNYIYVANGNSGKLLILQSMMVSNPPRIHLNHASLYFAATDFGTAANPQTFFISNTGESALEWPVSVDQGWLLCSPTSGIDSGEVTVSVHAAGLSAGTYTGEITVSDPDADNSPQKITVTLKVYGSEQTSAPFGQFDTPTDGSTVSSSLPVTGWVLDDIGVQSVQIFRGEVDSLVYIGDAVFVEGARPDVEQTYPGYPMNYKAGWGYMLLTHFLPGANGVFTLHAIAADVEGNYVWLGSKTITVDNAHAVKPFGTIDTPTQGGVVSGRSYMNYGWVLTPQPIRFPPTDPLSTSGLTASNWAARFITSTGKISHHYSRVIITAVALLDISVSILPRTQTASIPFTGLPPIMPETVKISAAAIFLFRTPGPIRLVGATPRGRPSLTGNRSSLTDTARCVLVKDIIGMPNLNTYIPTEMETSGWRSRNWNE